MIPFLISDFRFLIFGSATAFYCREGMVNDLPAAAGGVLTIPAQQTTTDLEGTNQ